MRWPLGCDLLEVAGGIRRNPRGTKGLRSVIRFFIWTFGLAFFLACTAVAYIYFPLPQGPLVFAEAGEMEELEERREERIEELRHQVRDTFVSLETLVRRQQERLVETAQRIETKELGEALLKLEMNPGEAEEILSDVRDSLLGVMRREELDFLLLVTADARMVLAQERSPGGSSDVSNVTLRERILEACGPVFRDSGAASGVEVLPGALVPASPRGEADDRSFFLISARPVWARPDTPQGVLMGGMSLRRIFERFTEKLEERVRQGVRWHQFSTRRTGRAVVTAGEEEGEFIRRTLLGELEEMSESEAPAFQQVGVQVGRWSIFRSLGGEVIGGWGITASPEAVNAPVAAPGSSASPGLLPAFPGGWRPRAVDLVLISGGVLVGLGLLGVLLSFWTRRAVARSAARQRVVKASSPPAISSPILIEEEHFDWLVGRLERLSMDTRQTFERRLQDFESNYKQSHELLRKELGVFLTGPEAADSRASGPARDPGLSLESSDLAKLEASMTRIKAELAEVTGSLGTVAKRLDRVDEEKVEREVERLENEWCAKLKALGGEIEKAHALGERLAKDLEASREEERKGRAALEESRQREEIAKEQELQASDSVGEELDMFRLELNSIRDFQGTLTHGNIPIAMLAVDQQLRIFVWNPAAESLLGCPASEALNQKLPALDIGCPELTVAITEEARHAMEQAEFSGRPAASFRLSDRGEVHVRIHCEPILSGSEGLSGVIVCIENLSTVANCMRECELHELFQETLIQSIPLGLVITDTGNRIIGWNRRAESALKVPEARALGENLLGLDCPLRETDFHDGLVKAVRKEKPSRFDVNSAADEQPLFRVTYAPFRWPGGETRGHVFLLEGVARKEPREQLTA